jgi:hypothetical protein
MGVMNMDDAKKDGGPTIKKTRGGFIMLGHKVDQPIPPDILTQLPEYIRPYAEPARLAILAEEMRHRDEHGHSFDGHPECLSGYVSMILRDLIKGGTLSQEDSVKVATAMMAIGSVIMFVSDVVRSMAVAKAIDEIIAGGDLPGGSVAETMTGGGPLGKGKKGMA